VDVSPLAQEGCSSACAGLSKCAAYTYDAKKRHGSGCYLYPTRCVASPGMSLKRRRRGPWSFTGAESCTQTSDNHPLSAQTYLKQTYLEQSYKKLPESGYCRASLAKWHCWLDVELYPLLQGGCSSACAGLSTCAAYTYDYKKTHGSGCYLYPSECAGAGMSVKTGERGPWSRAGAEACTQTSDNHPLSAQTYLKQAEAPTTEAPISLEMS